MTGAEPMSHWWWTINSKSGDRGDHREKRFILENLCVLCGE
jgi:hypothetical protein